MMSTCSDHNGVQGARGSDGVLEMVSMGSDHSRVLITMEFRAPGGGLGL